MRRPILVLFLVLAACAALKPHSFDESLALGYAAQTSVLTTATQLLTRKQITKEDAARILAISDQAGQALDAARDAKSTDLTTAQAQRSLATTVLDQLATYLATKGK
jgi:hypothetical protein